MYARAFIPGAVEYSINQYHIQPPPAEQKRAPKTPAGHPKQENTRAERRPPAGDNDRKKRAAARGGQESRPAAYVPGLTADRRQPAAAAIPGLHAVTIRQTAAGADRGQPKPAKTKNFTKSEGKSGRNERELAKIGTFVYILEQYVKESPPAAGVFLAKPGVNDRHRHPLTISRTATRGGEVYKSEGQNLFSMLRNSPLRLNVLHTGSNIRAISLSPPASMFPSPAHQAAFLKQVTGKLGVGGWF